MSRKPALVFESAPQQRLVVYPSTIKLGILVLGAAGFNAVCGFLFPRLDGIGQFFVGLSFVFLGICGIYALMRIIWRTPMLVVDAEGIHDNASALSAGLLRWQEILDYRVTEEYGRPQLKIMVVDSDAVIARAPWWRRFLMRANVKMGGTPVFIPQALLPITAVELAGEIARFRQSGAFGP